MEHNMLIIEQKDDWDVYLKKCDDREFYHSWEYHSLDKSGTPILFVLCSGNDIIALPLIKRNINGSDLYDLTSVYGYSGPISNKKFDEIDEETLIEFKSLFLSSLKRLKCISVFSRLHPFINQPHLVSKIGGLQPNGKTLYIDLSEPIEAQRSKYDKHLFKQVIQLRKKDYKITESTAKEDIEVFTEMYTDNMIRVNASKNYFFSSEYFTNLIQLLGHSCRLLMIFDGSIAICGAIIMHNNYIIRNHLSATHKDYLKESPSKLLTDEISLIGRRLGAKFFHMGGGVGGKEDSLFKFKSYFTRKFLQDFTWKYIADDTSYNSLVSSEKFSNPDYFPLYRSPRIQAQ